MQPVSPTLIQALRASLEQVQRSIDLHPHDPALRQLKSSVLLTLAELSRRQPRERGHRLVIQILPEDDVPGSDAA